MIFDKTHLIVFIVGAVLGICTGFFTGKAFYDRPIEATVKTDTIHVTDTVQYYLPSPKDSIRTKYVTRWMQVHDTTDRYIEVSSVYHDTVQVDVPITSKHYHSKEYDAWVSGYEPALDSINIYKEKEYITNTVTLRKQSSRFSVGLQGGYGYGFKSKTWQPYVGVGVGIRIL